MQQRAPMISENCSEVARLRQQITAEYESAQLAVHGTAMVGGHAFINARTERIAVLIKQLVVVAGPETAMEVMRLL